MTRRTSALYPMRTRHANPACELRVQTTLMETSSKLRHNVLIGYGSATGQAEDCADIIGDSLTAAGYHTHIVELNNVRRDPAFLRQFTLFVVVCSSSDDNDDHVPDNAAEFVDWLKFFPDLKNMPIALFTLGDSSYNGSFNAAGNLIENLLTQCGVKFTVPPGLADDEEGSPFEQLEPWVNNLSRTVKLAIPGSPMVHAEVGTPDITTDVA
ncbi:Flavodoxin [Carpediemonas membranifera]|uniref:Flavodoxin n=1 Tax=Carpediemonas membranifera TaxID=201153 RepID=A0A8J6BCY0_9EUKA|nr:Flavodoxin [Carpediemonas membranifera]|eukprot:KAG9394857.1 Flavodoxin [Carpediemonas membranifera]